MAEKTNPLFEEGECDRVEIWSNLERTKLKIWFGDESGKKVCKEFDVKPAHIRYQENPDGIWEEPINLEI